MKIKACALDLNYTSYKEVKERCVIAQGWSISNDVSFFRDEVSKEKYIKLIKSDPKDYNSKRNAFEGLFNIKSGDIFLGFEGARIAGICEVPESFAYLYDDEYEYPNSIFPVKWVDWDIISKDEAPTGFRPPHPIFNIRKQGILSYINDNWEKYKQTNNFQPQSLEKEVLLRKILDEMPSKIIESKKYYDYLLKKDVKMENINEYLPILKNKKQIILQGSPGTGKTYTAKDIAEKMIFDKISSDKKGQKNDLEKSDQFKLIQFHPAYSYEDFVRGIVAKTNNGVISYEPENNTLAIFAEKALLNWNEHNNPTQINELIWVKQTINEFKEHIISKLEVGEKLMLTEKVFITRITEKSIRYNSDVWQIDGTVPDSDLLKMFLAHVSSRKEIQELESLTKTAKSLSTYWLKILEQFKKYINDNGLQIPVNNVSSDLKNYVLIIDEINRANLPAVLGELIYALEYRGEMVESIYEIEEGGKDIILPPNLYIIGTMNTADRSVGHIDYAIRRRFAFVDINPDKEVINQVIEDASLREKANKLFDDVAKLFVERKKDDTSTKLFLASDFKAKEVQLGHSYFLAKSEEELNMKLDYEIKPILREYLKDGILTEEAAEEIESLKI